jgi:hypothetical protein
VITYELFEKQYGPELDKLIETHYRVLLTNDTIGLIRNWMNFYLSKKGVNPRHYVQIELA